MSEIKTADERLNGIDFSGNRVEVSTEEFVALNDEVSELRAAYEALQKENAELMKDRQQYANRADLSEKSVGVLKAENAAQAKRIAELEEIAVSTISDYAGISLAEAKKIISAQKGTE